jgi:hypothetical protein
MSIAKFAGFDTIVVDPRTAFATRLDPSYPDQIFTILKTLKIFTITTTS